jgi:hypothetical protein
MDMALQNSGVGMNGFTRLYYLFKPLLPVRARYALRRVRANYKLCTNKDWPISESAAFPPAGWRGWPGGKQFTIVLTHDVEGQVGLDRVLPLFELEASLGFRSSFNFVPEGEYCVDRTLREKLTSEGFEVGIHDLRHDGSLFASRKNFTNGAKHINRYLAQWKAVGFRAGFMFRNLEWLKDLEIEYDASTFDVDPFEPQPNGLGTIFPMWIPRESGGGYVELPYTLAQDSSLFLILREKTINLWKKKLDWIAINGGMVLLNLHPDYLAFDSTHGKINEFAPALYRELLQYIKDKYSGAYWHALPRDVSRFYRRHVTAA